MDITEIAGGVTIVSGAITGFCVVSRYSGAAAQTISTADMVNACLAPGAMTVLGLIVTILTGLAQEKATR